MKYPLHVYHREPGAPFHIMDAHAKVVASLPHTHKIEANALLRAVNAHEALVAALRELVTANVAHSQELFFDPESDGTHEALEETTAAVNDALAKAQTLLEGLT